MKKEEFEKILENYNLGKLKGFKKGRKEEYDVQPCFIIQTTKGKFFLKTYLGSRDFSLIRNGLRFLDFLRKKNYPAIKAYITKKGRPYLLHRKTLIAIFELMDLKENKSLTQKQACEFGKALGRLHKITRNASITKTKGYNYYFSLFEKNRHLKEKGPKLYREAIEYAKGEFKNLKVPKDQPKSVCHEEFTLEHVRFKNGKIVKVIDWDWINKGFLIYDLGTTMTQGFRNRKLDFNLLRAIIKGYESERKLTKWERDHLYEALTYGMFKYMIWGLDEPIRDLTHIKNILHLRDFGKEDFNKELKKEVK